MILYGIEASVNPLPPVGPPPGAPANFIAVGATSAQDAPVLMTTENTDASTWVDRSLAAIAASADAILQDVCYSASLTRWVAVGYSSGNVATFGDPVVIYSDDGGNTWTSATAAPSSDFIISGVCWSGAAFIAVGGDSGNANPRIMTSPDGITWTSRTSAPASSTIWYRVSGISGLAIACGSDDPIFGTGPATLMTSANDGTSWTQRTPAGGLTTASQAALRSGSTHIVAGIGSASTNGVQTSTDGTTWTNRTVPSDQLYYGAAWNGSIYVAVGADLSTNVEGRAASSTDGTTWTGRTTDPVTAASSNGPNWLDVACLASGGFVAVGRDNNAFTIPYIMYSANGTTWVARTPQPTSNAILLGVGSSG